MTRRLFARSLLAATLLASAPLAAQERDAAFASIAQLQQRMDGLPVGIVFFGTKWSEPMPIGIAYGFEQHTHAWQPPKFLDTVDGKPVMASSK